MDYKMEWNTKYFHPLPNSNMGISHNFAAQPGK